MGESNQSNSGLDQMRHSRWIYASNSSFQFTVTFLSTVQTLFLFFYYESVIGLNSIYVFLALTLFTIYDAVNDPIMGFLTDRNFKWTRKWGRRFPWIVIGIVPWCISLYLIYSVPIGIDVNTNPWPVFWWLVLSLIILDTFGTLVGINISALRPDKFRSEDERRILSGYFAFFDMIAQAIGMIVPPLFLMGGSGRENFAFMGALCATIGLISAVFFLPGSREEKVVIDRYYIKDTEQPLGFFQGIWEVIRLRSFIYFFIILTIFNLTINLLTNNIPYLTTYVLRASADTMTILFAVFLMGALVSVPFWLWLLKKTKNSKKMLSIGGFAFSFALIPMTFFVGFEDLLVYLIILGFSLGPMWAFFYTVIQADVCDDFVACTGKNQKAILIGATTLIGRFVATVDELIIAVVHNGTGFLPGYDTFDEMAAVVVNMDPILHGIRLISGLIPACIMLAGTILFWKKYPLTPDVVIANHAKLMTLGL